MLWGFIIMFIGVAVGIIGKKLVHQELVTVVGAQPDILSQSQPGKYLPPERTIEYVPSITERTTNLLENSAVAQPKQKEDGESQA